MDAIVGNKAPVGVGCRAVRVMVVAPPIEIVVTSDNFPALLIKFTLTDCW